MYHVIFPVVGFEGVCYHLEGTGDIPILKNGVIPFCRGDVYCNIVPFTVW